MERVLAVSSLVRMRFNVVVVVPGCGFPSRQAALIGSLGGINRASV